MKSSTSTASGSITKRSPTSLSLPTAYSVTEEWYIRIRFISTERHEHLLTKIAIDAMN